MRRVQHYTITHSKHHHLPSSGTGARGTLGQGRVGLTLNIQLQTPAFNIENVSIVGISEIFVSLASVLDWVRSYFWHSILWKAKQHYLTEINRDISVQSFPRQKTKIFFMYFRSIYFCDACPTNPNVLKEVCKMFNCGLWSDKHTRHDTGHCTGQAVSQQQTQLYLCFALYHKGWESLIDVSCDFQKYTVPCCPANRISCRRYLMGNEQCHEWPSGQAGLSNLYS